MSRIARLAASKGGKTRHSQTCQPRSHHAHARRVQSGAVGIWALLTVRLCRLAKADSRRATEHIALAAGCGTPVRRRKGMLGALRISEQSDRHRASGTGLVCPALQPRSPATADILLAQLPTRPRPGRGPTPKQERCRSCDRTARSAGASLKRACA
jgi:hypothetical protein